MKKNEDISIPISLLEKFTSFLKNLKVSELKELESGDRTVKFSLQAKRKKGVVAPSAQEILKNNDNAEFLRELKDKLYATNDRDDGLFILERHCPSRGHLEALAKLIDLPTTKRDTIEHLRKKIVETTIGYKLRSNAIRGKSQVGK